MAIQRQTSYDFRAINLESEDYESETGAMFLVYVGIGGAVKIHNETTDEAVLFENVLSDRTLEFYTKKVYKDDTDATNLIAIY